MMNKFHLFHMITPSPWPILSSLQSWNLMNISTMWLYGKTLKSTPLIFLMMVVHSSMSWWKNTIKETSKNGEHHSMIIKGLKLGMILFIASEVLFFTAFFWGFFHSSMSPNFEIGQVWPPNSINSFNPINVPLLNTTILISSGVSITWAHHSLSENKLKKSTLALLITWMLGIYFSLLQLMEYSQAEFNISDATYGCTFFMATGFHGFHVIVGTTFLISNFVLMKKMKLTFNHHTGMEMAAWYWHFVDIVWLFLYLSMYWWGK